MRSLEKPTPAINDLARIVRASTPAPSWTTRTTVVKDFKSAFLAWALSNQNHRCAFCCFPVDDIGPRRPFSIDHIAPKGASHYPQWAFETLNLVIACWSCNSNIKRAANTVAIARVSYRKCKFRIVHPYLDDVETHVSGTYRGGADPVAAPVPRTPEGQETISAFHLDDVNHISSANHEALRFDLDQRQGAMTAAMLLQLRRALEEVTGRS
jgi:hypothetical protein